MSAGAATSSTGRDPPVARTLTMGLALGVGASLFAAVGLGFCGVAAFLSLTPVLEPRWAALTVAGASLALAALIGGLARLMIGRSAQRAAAWIKSSALIAMAPHLLRFIARHARLAGLLSAAGAVIFAARSHAAK